jgi:hypothetical protein
LDAFASAVTPKVRQQKPRKARVRAVCAKMTSGQLPFLGSKLYKIGLISQAFFFTNGYDWRWGASRILEERFESAHHPA